MNNLESCTKICGFNAIIACGEYEGGKDLKEACEEACAQSGDFSAPNASVLGWQLIGEQGCDKFFPMKKPEPKLTTQEMVEIGAIALGVLLFLLIVPKPIPI